MIKKLYIFIVITDNGQKRKDIFEIDRSYEPFQTYHSTKDISFEV
jgi:hypothetical protein